MRSKLCNAHIGRCLIGLIAIALLFALPVSAGSPLSHAVPANSEKRAEVPGTLVSIKGLIETAYKQNPSILAARQSWKASIESYRVVTGLPNPRVMSTYFTDPIQTKLGPQDWNLTITQPVPFPGKLSRAGEVTSAESKIAKLKLDKTIRDVTLSIQESFWEIYYVRQARQTAKHNMQLLSYLRKIAETGYAQNKAMLVDVVKAQSRTAQLRYDLLLLDDLEDTSVVTLNGLLNRPANHSLGILEKVQFEPLVYSIDEMYKLAELNYDGILIAAAKVDKARANVSLARIRNLPDFSLGLFYAGIGEPDVPNKPQDAGQDALGIQAGMTLPIWFGKNRGRVARAKAQESSAKASENSSINDVRTRIRTTWFKLQNAQRIMDLYKNELLPQAYKSLEISETWYREQRGTFSDLVEAQSVLYNFQLAHARAMADYGKRLALLERLVGQPLCSRKADTPDASAKEAQ